MAIFLNIFYAVLLVVYVPVLWSKGKLHQGYWQRLGSIDLETKRRLADKKHIWIHAVSVGEVMAVRDLVMRLLEHNRTYPIVCTTVTKTGHALAKKIFGNQVEVLYAPLDFSGIVKKFINTIHPQVYIAAETEWWPNLYSSLHKKKIPILQINGRISDKALKGYKKIPFLTQHIFRCVTKFYMQSEAQKTRIIQLGADQAKVEVLGNLKFDNLVDTVCESHPYSLKSNALWIAGSTHPGEEEIVLESYNRLKQDFQDLRLVLCPRHLERVPDVVSIVQRKGYTPIHFSKWNKRDFLPHEIVVVDTIGHLSELYRMAKMVFIGKTLKVGGGQNMLEPANFGVPTIVGPHTQNFQQVMEILLDEGAIIQIQDASELTRELKELMENPIRYSSLGNAAKRVVHRYKGATQRTLEKVQIYL